MGEVYVGLREGIGQFQKPLAVKLLLPHLTLNTRAVQRFLDEARLTAQLSHPNIAQVFDVGFADDRYFLAMELVRGASLSALIAELAAARAPPDAEVISFIGRCLCDGLHHAHQLTGPAGEALDVVHRDVTPHNVLVSADGAVKVTDFGVARMRDGTVETSPGVVLGKLGYMAPEQLRGAQVDRRADVFGVGATLFTLAALRPPFGDALAVVRTRPQLELLRPDLPAPLLEAIARALSERIEDRFATARQMRDALPFFPDGAEKVGALVTQRCAVTVQRVDAQTTLHSTQSVEAQGTEAAPVRAPRARTSGVRLGLAAAALVAVGVGTGLLTREPAPREAAPLAAVRPSGPPAAAAPAALPAPATLATASPNGLPASAVLPVPAAPATASPSARPPRPRPEAVPRAAPGYLSIDARPWASVFVDGQRVGDTPLGALPVEPGRHVVKLVNPDTGKQHEEKVTVRPGETRTLKADLR